jgi:hypothetical protein
VTASFYFFSSTAPLIFSNLDIPQIKKEDYTVSELRNYECVSDFIKTIVWKQQKRGNGGALRFEAFLLTIKAIVCP